MPGRRAFCAAWGTLTLACAGNQPPPSQSAAPTVVVNLDDSATRSSEPRLPALGAPGAPVTIVALLAFSDVESAATYQALRRLQARLGERELRLVLATPNGGGAREVMADTLRQHHGDAAYFDFATRIFDQSPAAFGDALKLALDISRAHARDAVNPERDSSQPVVWAEADALRESDDPVIPALSVNGIRVYGRLPPNELEALVSAEHEAARALARKGIAARAVYPERVASNADRVVRRGAPPSATAPEASAPGPTPADGSERVWRQQ